MVYYKKFFLLFSPLILEYLNLSVYATQGDLNKNSFSLEMFENSIEEKSILLKQKAEEVNLQKFQEEITKSTTRFKVSLDGNYYYQEKIPELNLIPSKKMNFGSHSNYSVGINLGYNLIDFSENKLLVNSNNKLVLSKEFEYKKVKKDQLYMVRILYVDLILLKEERKILKEALKVSKIQFKEVSLKNKLGSASSLDLNIARKEVNELKIKLQQNINQTLSVQTDIVSASQIKNADFLIKEYQNIEKINLESFDTILSRFNKYKKYNFYENDSLEEKILEAKEDAFKLEAQSILKKSLPDVKLFARSSLENPMGPEINDVHQNIIGLKVSFPFYDGGAISAATQLKMAQSRTLYYQKKDIQSSKTYLTKSLQEKIDILTHEKELIKLKIKDNKNISKLVYESYKAGKITFIDVERANTKYREARLLLTHNLNQTAKVLIMLSRYAGE